MANPVMYPSGDPSAPYQIIVKGKIRQDWSDWLSGMEIDTAMDGEGTQITRLVGVVADQAALRGILCKIWDLNLTVLSISQVTRTAGEKVSEDNE